MAITSLASAILLLAALHTGMMSRVYADAQCFFRDGTPADNSSFKPCFSYDRPNGACCSIAKTNGESADICLANGLCYAQDSTSSGMIFLDACTDKEWSPEKCPGFCNSVDEQGDAYIMTPCPSRGRGFWCCSKSGDDCCNNASKISMPTLVTETPAIQTSPASNSPVTTPTSTETNEQCEDSKAVYVGTGVGVALGACLLAMSAGLIFQNRAHKKALHTLQKKLDMAANEPEPVNYGNAIPSPECN